MNKKKVIITGSGGFVGKYLYKILEGDFDVLGLGNIKSDYVDKAVDVSNEKLTIEILDEFMPDEVVHLAALSNVEKCEIDRDLADKNNILPVKILAEWVKKNDKRIIFVSTDYVFDGINGNFSESDIENPIQYYGQTKLVGEKMVSALKKYIIFRPTVIYGWDPDGMNFFMQMYKNQKDCKVMNVPIDQISNPVSVIDLCRLIKRALNIEVFGKFITTGNEKFSRYDFALKICDYMGWNKDLFNPVTTELLKQVAKRPLNNSTINNLATNSFNFTFNDLKENLRTIKNEMIIGI